MEEILSLPWGVFMGTDAWLPREVSAEGGASGVKHLCILLESHNFSWSNQILSWPTIGIVLVFLHTFKYSKTK